MRHLLPACCPSVLKANSLRAGTLSFLTVIVSFSACLLPVWHITMGASKIFGQCVNEQMVQFYLPIKFFISASQIPFTSMKAETVYDSD